MSYGVTAVRPGMVAFVLSSMEPQGAHAAPHDTCVVVDTKSSKLVQLRDDLDATGLSKLSSLATATLRAQSEERDLRKLGFASESITVSDSDALCVADDHGGLALEIRFHPDDLAGFAVGTKAELAASKVRGIFKPDSFASRIFR